MTVTEGTTTMTQTTLLVSHKGVDLHAATAVRVMQRRLEGGDALRALHRGELHTFWDAGDGRRVSDLLEIGRFFNPNKHHYGHFELAEAGEPWLGDLAQGGAALDPIWPGSAVASDLAPVDAGLTDRLLGGTVPDGHVAVDVAAFPLGEPGPILSGVLWRLILVDDGRDPGRLADKLTVARSGDQGLLVNPHLHGWLTAVRRP
jgi:hypothetical protein